MHDEKNDGSLDRPFVDKFSELDGGLICVVIAIYTYTQWQLVPDQVAIHFNASGDVNRYGSKWALLGMLALMIAMYVLFTILTRFPRTFNYAVKITDENREVQEQLAKSFMRVMGLETVLLFAYLQWVIINGAVAGATKLSAAVMSGWMLLLFGSIGIYLYLSIKKR